MARLDRLATVKSLAQLAATLGREFPYDLLQAVAPWDEGTLQRGLHQLVEAEFLYQQGLPPQGTYLFKHALIQEAAYQSLLRSTRQRHHQSIAQVLEARFPGLCETQPELLAHHFTEAGLSVQAVPYWQRAGQRAMQRSANAETVSHISKGLELLRTLADTPERTRQELEMQTMLAPALMATKGFAAPEVMHAYARARELCGQVGDTPQLFIALRGLWAVSLVRAELAIARELGEQLLRLAQSMQNRGFLLEAHRAMGATLSDLGELALAHTHFEQAIALYDPEQHRSHAFLYGGQDPRVFCHAHVAVVVWLLGYPDQALQRSHEALTLAQELAHPFSVATALAFTAQIHRLRREGPPTQERAEALLALSYTQGFAQRSATGTILRGWALAEQCQSAEGIVQIRQGIAALRATGAELGVPNWSALLAEACGRAGQVEEGLATVSKALAAVEKTGERCWGAELYRLQGELLVRQPAHREQEAEACFHQALAVARRQQAKSWELRAAMSLSHLWQRQGQRAAARELLAPVYGWFTEGFDAADLREAKTLLAELS
jgi:predicted ATPase